jgi:predicted RNase H-like HicB family nuclease
VRSRSSRLHRHGITVEETRTEIRAAIQFHLDALREDGQPIPTPSILCEYVEA